MKMKHENIFFEESCLECFQPCDMCPEKEKIKCYIEWADKKITEQKNTIKKIKIKLVELNKIVLEEQ